MILELGGGKEPRPGTDINIDKRNFESVDMVHDLENGIPLMDETVGTVFVFHILEHVEDLEYLMSEIHRVCFNNAMIIGEVPYYKDENAFTDPTHQNFFTLNSFDYWDSSTELGEYDYFDEEFKILYIGLKRRYKYRFWKGLGPIEFELRVRK